MKRTLLLAGACAALLFALTGIRAQSSRPTPHQEFMRQKLEHSKNVLEGLATENFDLISKHARKLSAMSQEPGWHAFDNPGYAWRSEMFRRNVDALVKTADDKNLDGATLAYVKVTMSCVECHKFVRGKEAAHLQIPEAMKRSSL